MASTWHRDEDKTGSAKKRKKERKNERAKAGHEQFPEYGTTCETENKMQHNREARAVAAHTSARGWMSCCLHPEGRGLAGGIRGKGRLRQEQ